MIQKGKLFKRKTPASIEHATATLCQVSATFDKPDIDPECPESVAIVGMVRVVYLDGPEQGREITMRRRSFNRSWECADA
jgi:hypothetical protein